MNYIRAAYVVDGYLPFVTREDLDILTHINIAFGLVKNGEVSVAYLKHTDCIAKIREMNPNVRIILSVGGWGAGGFSNAAKTDEGCRLFAKSAADIQRKYCLDGIDIDWEYPCLDWADIDAAPEDKQNFTRMLRYLREELDNCKAYDGGRCILTIAAGAGNYFADISELPVITEILDFISIMTYDLAGGRLDGHTGHHTSLYNPGTGDKRFEWGGAAAAEYFHANGVPFNKLVFGAAFYSRRFDEVENKNNGLFQKTGTICLYGPGYGDLYKNYINKNGWLRFWDDAAKAPWLWNGSSFITYDDDESIAEKCRYIKEKGILGVMYWEHSCDSTRRLLSVIGRDLADN